LICIFKQPGGIFYLLAPSRTLSELQKAILTYLMFFIDVYSSNCYNYIVYITLIIERHCLKKGIVGRNGTTPSKDFAKTSEIKKTPSAAVNLLKPFKMNLDKKFPYSSINGKNN